MKKKTLFVVTSYLQGCSMMKFVEDLNLDDFAIINILKTQEEYNVEKVIVVVDDILKLRNVESYLNKYKSIKTLYIARTNLQPYIYGYFVNSCLDYEELKKNIRDFLLDRFTYKKAYNPFSLTKREEQVMECIYNGYGVKETSKVLNISYKTVDAHVQNIYKKTGFHNLTSLSMLARCSK